MERQAAAERRQAEEPRARYGAVGSRVETEIVEDPSGRRCSDYNDLEGGAARSEGNHAAQAAFKRNSRIMRNMVFCAMFAITAPFMLLGQELDRTVQGLPTMIPSQRWRFTAAWDVPYHNPLSASTEHSFQAVKHASKLGSRAMHVSSTTIHAADQSHSNHAATNQTRYMEGFADTGKHSLLSFGPFMFSVGLLLSIILKLVCAQPCAKAGTDMLHAFVRDQLEKEDALAAAEDPGMASNPQVYASQPPTYDSAPGSLPGSWDRGSDRWPCKLDLPEAPTPTPIKMAEERASSANPWDTVWLDGDGQKADNMSAAPP